MQRLAEINSVLAAYPADCQPTVIAALGGAGGFSGAKLWRLTTRRGPLCLRRWPPEHPDEERLRWIQQVVKHAVDRGFCLLLPAAISTSAGDGYVQYDGHLWELTPWMPGVADYWRDLRPEKLRAAMTVLAEFHRAAETFPADAPRFAMSEGIADRRALVDRLLTGMLDQMRTAIALNRMTMPALAEQAEELFRLISPQLTLLHRELTEASRIKVRLQPCLRDVWHDHVLFEADQVSGIIDLGSMRTESVAADIARLLGSLCGNDRQAWSVGLAAYEAGRPLAAGERTLLAAFDRSQLLLAGVKWVEWVFVEQRTFSDPPAVVQRMEHILKRLREA